MLNACDEKIAVIYSRLQKTDRIFYFVSDHLVDGVNRLVNIVLSKENFSSEFKEIAESEFCKKHDDIICYIINPFVSITDAKKSLGCVQFEQIINMPKNKIIGVTGPTGSGKSTVCELLRKRGYFIVSADQIAREVSRDKEVLNELVNAFGNVLNKNGELNRKKLAAKAFKTKGNTVALNKIMHPRIIGKMFDAAIGLPLKTPVIFDAPQLLEADLDKYCDIVLAINCSIETRRQRIIKRDNLTEQEASKRIMVQYPWAAYERAADKIVNGESNISNMENQLLEIGL